jgi:hypothetical protein
MRSPRRTIPESIFSAERPKVSLFLNRLFTVDGRVDESSIVLWSSSAPLLGQVQHLLARFCIRATAPVPDDAEALDTPTSVRSRLRIDSRVDIHRFRYWIGTLGGTRPAVPPPPSLEPGPPLVVDRIHSVRPTRVAPVYELLCRQASNVVVNDFVVCGGIDDGEGNDDSDND